MKVYGSICALNPFRVPVVSRERFVVVFGVQSLGNRAVGRDLSIGPGPKPFVNAPGQFTAGFSE